MSAMFLSMAIYHLTEEYGNRIAEHSAFIEFADLLGQAEAKWQEIPKVHIMGDNVHREQV